VEITLESGDYGTYLLVCEDGRDLMIQTDYDYPGIASNLGWSPQRLHVLGCECGGLSDVGSPHAVMKLGQSSICCCSHKHTDGTIDCKECGTKGIAFINSAREYLDDHIGESFEDPGYFAEECQHEHQRTDDRMQQHCLDCGEELGR